MGRLIKYSLILMIMGSVKAQSSNTIIEAKSPYYPDKILFTTEIPGLGEEFVYTHWQNYLQKHGGTTQLEQDEHGNIQIKSTNVQFPPLDNKKVIIETLLRPNTSETGVDLSISIQKGDGKYISSFNENKTVVEDLKKWLLQFNRNLRALEKEEVFNPIKAQKEIIKTKK